MSRLHGRLGVGLGFLVGVLLVAGVAAWPRPPVVEPSGRTVRDFGAVGDGQADDTGALQKAVNAGGTVVLPAGVYRVTRTVRLDLEATGVTALVGTGTARVVMAGAGPAFHITGSHGGTAAPETVKPNVWAKQRNPVVRGLEIVGDHAEADGIRASGTLQLTLAEVLVRECRHAVHLTGRNRNLLVSACHIYHNRGCGIYYDAVNLHQSNIVGCHISYCAGGGVVLRGGEVRNVHIGTCDIESNMTPDHPNGANILIDCAGGSTDEVAITGCTIQHNSKSPGSANIRILGKGITSGRDPTPTQEGHVTITGNVLSDVRVNVHLANVRGATITGNTFWEGFDHDLLVEDCQAIVIGSNDFDRNPRYTVNGNWGKDTGGLTFRNVSDSKLTGFLVKGVWGRPVAVQLEKCHRCTLTDLSILDSDGVGLLLKDCTRCKVSDCVITDDRAMKKATHALKVEGGKENWIRGNVFGNAVAAEKPAALLEGNQQ